MKLAIKVGGLASACLLVLAGTVAFAQGVPAQQLPGNVAPPASQAAPLAAPVAQGAQTRQAPTQAAQQFPAQPYQGAAQQQPQYQQAPGTQAPGAQAQQMPVPTAQQFPGQQPQPVQPVAGPQPGQGMTVAAVPLAADPTAAPASAPASLPPLPPVQADIDRYSQNFFGASPEQIREMYRVMSETQRAVAQPGPAPKPVTGTISVSLSPGTTPPVIRTYMGTISTFVVVDSSGAPWPVENFRIGNQAAYQLNRLDQGQGSAFALDTAAPYGASNLVLKLVGVSTPVVINLVSGQKEVDARVEVRVQGRGPNAVSAMGVSLPKGVDSRLLPILNGLSPEGGKLLSVNGLEGVRAWMMPSGRMVVRTPVKIISPASPTFVSSADGTHVYEFMPTTQLMGLVDGQFVTLQVGGW